MRARGLRARELGARLQRVGDVVRRIVGAPDYERYLAHMSECHPETAPLSRQEFTMQRMSDRYTRPGARCC